MVSLIGGGGPTTPRLCGPIVTPGGAPRQGGPERARRVGRWAVALGRMLRAVGRVRGGGVSAIPFAAVRCIGDTIKLDVDGESLEAGRLEGWLAEHVIRRIPGSGTDAGEERK